MQSPGSPSTNPSQTAVILMKTDRRDPRKMKSVPDDGHGSGARRGAGAGTLSSSKRAHTVAVAIPGQGPLAGGHHQTPHPVLFPFNCRNPILQFFVQNAKSILDAKSTNVFLKKFQNRMKSPKISSTANDPLKKNFVPIESPESDTLLQVLGVGGFYFLTFAPSCERRFCRSQNAPGSHKIGLGSFVTARAAKYRAPPAPATLLF
jgi:hypothetical protein